MQVRYGEAQQPLKRAVIGTPNDLTQQKAENKRKAEREIRRARRERRRQNRKNRLLEKQELEKNEVVVDQSSPLAKLLSECQKPKVRMMNFQMPGSPLVDLSIYKRAG